MSVKIVLNKDVVNIEKLINEFAAAGFHQVTHRKSEFVTVLDSDDEKSVMSIYTAHDPTETPQTEIAFELPIRAPSITVDDIFVESRTIKDDPDEAFAEALAETSKAKGQAKSLDLIARSSAKMLEKLRAQVKELEKRVKKLEK